MATTNETLTTDAPQTQREYTAPVIATSETYERFALACTGMDGFATNSCSGSPKFHPMCDACVGS